VQRQAILWVLVVFFGASLVFGTLRRLTEDSSAGVIVGVQVGALVLLVAGIVAFMKLRERR
jgi:hypothetical protein